MNFDILNQNLLLWVCIIFVSLFVYLVLALYQAGPKEKLKGKKQIAAYTKKNRLYFLGALFLAVVCAPIISLVAAAILSSTLPIDIAVMCLPFTGSVMLLALAICIKKRVPLICLAGAAMLISILFSLLLINNYYRYYHTIGNVLGKTTVQTFGQGNVATLQYTIGRNQDVYNKDSLQGSLDAVATAATNGSVYKMDIPGTLSRFKPRPEYVYIPAIYNSPAHVSLPVLELTAGDPGNPSDWVGLGLQNIMDQFAKNHEGITPLVVVADSTGSFANDTECVDSSRGNIETYLTQDVPTYIKQHFNVDTSPSNWAIGGLSMGGMCALMLSLRHPDIYNYFIDLGGEGAPEVGSKEKTIRVLFNGSESEWAAHQPGILLAQKTYKNMGGFFGDGNEDDRVVTNSLAGLTLQSKRAGLDVLSETINGSHTFNVWAQTFKDSLPWISNRIGATRCSASCL